MHIRDGHPAQMTDLMIICKLICGMSFLFVLLLLKGGQLLMIEQQSTSYSYPWMVPLLWSTRKTMSIRLVKIATAEIIYRAAQDILKVYYREILKATSMRGLNLSHIVQIYHGYQEYSGSTVLTY